MVEGQTVAAFFFSNGGDSPMFSDGKYVGTNTETSFAPLVRSFTLPPGFNMWSFPNNVSRLEGGVGFCLVDGSILVLLDGEPCANRVRLIQAGKSYFTRRVFRLRPLISRLI